MTDQRRARAYEALHEAEDNFNADNSGNKLRHFQVDAMLKFADAERKAERERCIYLCRQRESECRKAEANARGVDERMGMHYDAILYDRLAEAIEKLGD